MKTIAQQLGIKEFPFEIKDKKGNRIYYEYFDGTERCFNRTTFDSKGREIYHEDSYGYSSSKKYNDSNNSAKFVDNEGYEYTQEFDIDGKVVYFEDNLGYIFDNRKAKLRVFIVDALDLPDCSYKKIDSWMSKKELDKDAKHFISIAMAKKNVFTLEEYTTMVNVDSINTRDKYIFITDKI